MLITRVTIGILAVLPLSLPSPASPQTTTPPNENDSSVVSYRNSPDLPDEIAFRQFLALIQTGPENPEPIDLPMVARALGIAPDEYGGYESARPYAEMFHEIIQSAEHDKASEKYEVLCTPNRVARSDAESLNALIRTEDLDDEVNKRYYLETLNRLSEVQRSHFQDFLEKVKLGTSYVRTNARAPGISQQVEVEKYCAELGYKLEVWGNTSENAENWNSNSGSTSMLQHSIGRR
jgi:hypothetical protein